MPYFDKSSVCIYSSLFNESFVNISIAMIKVSVNSESATGSENQLSESIDSLPQFERGGLV